MYATFQFLNSICDNRLSKMTSEDVVKEYQQYLVDGKDTSRHIAEIFCKNFGAWNKIYSLYSGTIPQDDASSFILECLSKAMKDWDSKSGITFLTYAHRCLNLKLKWNCEYWYAFKGRNVKNDSIERTIEECGDCFGGVEESYSSVDILAGMKNKLTDDEYKVVKIIMSSPKVNKPDVAAITGLTPYTVDCIYNSLKKKLAGAF